MSETKTPAEIARENFELRSAVTVAVLAAVLAIVTSYSRDAGSTAQLASTQAADAWSYYQSETMKAHTFEVERDLIQVLAPGAVDEAKRAAFVASCAQQAEKYQKKKAEEEVKARDFERQVDDANRCGTRYGQGSLLLQIAVVIVSVSFIVRRSPLYFSGLLLGLSGLYVAITPLVKALPHWMGGLG
jgi:hypothetical protein